MPSFGGDIGVCVKERCLDEELVDIPRECDHVLIGLAVTLPLRHLRHRSAILER